MKTTHVYVLCLLCSIPLFSLGQVNLKKFHIELVELLYNEDLQFQFMDEIPIDLRVVYRRDSDGKRKVKIFRNNNSIKKYFSIETKQGRYHEGQLYYRQKDVFRNGGMVDLRIRDKLGSGFSKEFQLHIPLLQAIEMSYDDSQVGPGKRIPIDLTLYYEGGHSYSIYDPQKGSHIRENNFPTVEDLTIQSDERVVLERKRRSLGLLRSIIEPRGKKKLYLIPSLQCEEEILLQTELKHYPGIVGALNIPMTYNASYAYNFDGERIHSKGTDALPLDIYLKKIRYRNRDLLWIKVQNVEKTEETLFDPLLGSVNISCRGGSGREGMDGNDGADGSKDPPSSGCDGSAGSNGGDGGDGAVVSIYTDEESAEFLHLLHIDNSGGKGGDGGDGGEGGDGAVGKFDGSDGPDGADGRNGQDGPLPKQIFLSPQTLVNMIHLPGFAKE